jgi:tRNA pseudouridine38-40 synthase
MRIRLTIAYDGGGYTGWQMQKTGVGVQQKVEQALGQLFPHAGRVHSSSRTDTGVHAVGMVAHVDIPEAEFRMPVNKLRLALNAHLPEDIRVLSAQRCAADFHARFEATGKQYRYFLWNHAAMNPLWRRHAWHIPGRLDVEAMRLASRAFLGRHDFRSFAGTRHYEPASTVRTVKRCDVRRRGCLWTFVIEGDGFLYRMCRGMVGTLVQVGQGKIAVDAIAGILAQRDRRVAGMTAPAHGLVLWRVEYRLEEQGIGPGEGVEWGGADHGEAERRLGSRRGVAEVEG